MAQNEIDPLLDGISPDLDEPTVDAPPEDPALANAAGVEEPGSGEAPAPAGPAEGPLAIQAAKAGVEVPSELDLARREEESLRERVRRLEAELEDARRNLASASVRITKLRATPTLEECNAAAARIEAAAAAEREQAAKVVYVQKRKPYPPLPGAVSA